MGFFSSLLEAGSDLKDGLKHKARQFNNATFKNSLMAVCALIAAADGTIEPEEKTKVAKLIGSNEALADFDAVELRDTFLGYCDKAKDEFARFDLLSEVRKIKGHRDQAETAMKIGLIIANADGNFDDSEKKVVVELCKALGLPSEDYVS
jgi:tellurite resistance protein TerB